jgi:hypothetical protein
MKNKKGKTSKTGKIKIDLKEINKEIENDRDKTYEYICKKGWNAYIDRCVDIIYFNFKNFGWTYGENEAVTRDRIENNIMRLICDSLKEKTQIECGRIAVDTLDDGLQIALAL